jgi:outer membrane protein assembly factor BamB
VATLGGEVLRMEAATGRVVARYAVGAPVRSQPIMADGWIYVGTENGRLVGIDTHDPKVSGWSTWGGDAARTGAAR